MSESPDALEAQRLAFEMGEIDNPFFDAIKAYCNFVTGVDDEVIHSGQASNEQILGMVLATIKSGNAPSTRIAEDDIRAAISEHGDSLLSTEPEDDLAVLGQLKKALKENPNPLQLVVTAFLAAEHMPSEGYAGERIPKRSKGREDTGQRIYRNAIDILRSYAQMKHISKDEALRFMGMLASHGITSLDNLSVDTNGFQGFSDAISKDDKLRTQTQLATMSNDILTMFETNTPQQINDGISRTYRQMARSFRFGITMDETGWEILPAELVEATGRTGIREEDEERGKSWDYVDWSRIETLKRYVRSWPGAYMAVASLESQSHEEYYVAVLPAMIGGLAVEHALADNPSSGNAVYVWRAEKGMDRSSVAVSWKGVYKRTKRMARALGARRMLHTENLEWNIMDYLTRPEDELDNPGYSKPN